MSMHTNTITHIQEMYFAVCDLLNGEPYHAVGYATRKEMLEEFKTKLERIEAEFRELSGIDP